MNVLAGTELADDEERILREIAIHIKMRPELPLPMDHQIQPPSKEYLASVTEAEIAAAREYLVEHNMTEMFNPK